MKHISVAACLVVAVLLVTGCVHQSGPDVRTGAVVREDAPVVPVQPASDLRTPVIFSSSRFVALAVKPQDLDGMAGVELWYTKDQGNEWLNHGLVAGKPESLKFSAPSDGKYGFLRVYVDKAGVRSVDPRFGTLPEQYVVVDTTPPAVEVMSPNGNEVYRAGATTLVKWTAEDVNLTPSAITIEISSNIGKTWQPVAKQEANDGQYYLDLPAVSSREYKIRVTAADAAGNVASDESDLPFTIDGLPPSVQIIGPAASNTSKTEIRYAAADIGGSGLASVKLYVTTNNGTAWEYYGEDADLTSPFSVTLLDGTYGMSLVAVDKMGNMTDIPTAGTAPTTTVMIDSTKPEIVLMSFHDGAVYAADHEYRILWGARDNVGLPTNAITLEYSTDNGLTFLPIGKDLENNGIFTWKTPAVSGKMYRIRVTARDIMRNTTEVISPAFVVDSAVPEAIAVGPKTSDASNTAIEYTVRNTGESPLTRVTLWITPDGGKTWMEAADDADRQSPVMLPRGDGRYGLFVSCATDLGVRTGKRQKDPVAGTAPQCEIVIDATPPALTLTEIVGFHRGGERVELLWECREANPDEKGMSILYSDNGGSSWSEVAASLDPRLGKYVWDLPRKSSRNALFRMTAVDALGNKTVKDFAKVFVVDAEAPSTRVLKRPDRSKYRRISLVFEAADATSGIGEVAVYGINRDGKRGVEKLASIDRATGELNVDLPEDGVWDLAIVATDGAGNREKEAVTERDMFFSVIVDTMSPKVEIRKHQTESGAFAWVDRDGRIGWSAIDSRTPADRIVVHVEYSVDGGKTWFLLADKQKHETALDVRGMLTDGKQYRFRVTAVDETGNHGFVETSDMGLEIFPRNKVMLTSSIKTDGVPGGTECEFSWHVAGTCKEASLEQNKEGEDEWKRVAKLATPSHIMQLPDAHGVYRYRVAAVDHFGRIDYSESVAVRIVMPPSPVVRLISAAAGDVVVGSTVTVSVEVSGGVVNEMWLESREGELWRRLQRIDSKVIVYDVGREARTSVLRVCGKDSNGRDVVSNVVELTVVMPPLPVVVLSGGNGEKSVEAGAVLSLTCSVTVGKAVAVWLEEMKAGGWEKIRDIAGGTFSYDVGKEPGSRTLRVALKDPYERIATSESLAFEIVPPPLSAIVLERVNDAPAVVGGKMTVRLKGFERLKACALHIRMEKGEWSPLHAMEARESEIVLPSETGVFFLRASGVDEYRRDVVSPELEIVVRTADEIKTSVALLNFRGGEVVWGGNAKVIFLRVEGLATLENVVVELSDRSGDDGSWRAVPKSDLTPVKHGFNWRTPPVTGRTYRLRVVWTDGKTTIADASASDFAIDATLPTATATGPATAAKAPVEILYDVTESIAKVTDVALYYSKDDGATWRSGNMAEVGKPLTFSPVEEGTYGIVVVPRNAFNKSAGAPASGARPQLAVDYRTAAPPPKLEVRALPLKGDAFASEGLVRSDAILLIEWNCNRDDPKATAVLALRVGDRVVEEIAEALPASGSHAWKVRAEDLRDCSILITVGVGDETAIDRTSTFRIDNSPPRSRSGFDPFE